MRVLFGGLPLDKISTSMTINAPAAVLLLLYQLVAAEQGVDGPKLTGTIQNDVLKEYIARGTYIFPPKASPAADQRHLRLLPRASSRAGTRSPSPATTWPRPGRRPRRRSRSRWPNAKEYVRAAQAAGLASTTSAPRLSFFFVARTTLLEEVAKFRAARRIWARIMKDEFGVDEPQVADAAVPHPDRGRPAHRAAARGQPRAGRAPGAGRRARRDPVAAHELLRRGDRAADREGGPAGAAHPAGHRLRDRRDEDGRPVRGVVRRRVAHRRRSRRRSSP